MAPTSDRVSSLPEELRREILCHLLIPCFGRSLGARPTVSILCDESEDKVAIDPFEISRPYTPVLQVCRLLLIQGAKLLYEKNRFLVSGLPSLFARQIGRKNATYITQLSIEKRWIFDLSTYDDPTTAFRVGKYLSDFNLAAADEFLILTREKCSEIQPQWPRRYFTLTELGPRLSRRWIMLRRKRITANLRRRRRIRSASKP